MDLFKVSDLLDFLRIALDYFEKVKRIVEGEQDEKKRNDLLKALDEKDYDSFRLILFGRK